MSHGSRGFGMAVNKPYVCVEPKGEVNVRSAFDLASPMVRKLNRGDVVQGRMTCVNAEGHLRLQLDDGSWTSVHSGTPTQPFLLPAMPANHHYLCVESGAVNIRGGYHIDAPLVRQLSSGDVVRGVLACPSPNGHLRLLLDDGNWTSIHPGTPQQPFLRPATPIDEAFVCADRQGVKLRRGLELESAQLRLLKYGEVVQGILTCMSGQGHLRVCLADGSWTSVHAGCIQEPFLHRATLVRGADFVCVDRNGVNVRQGFDINSPFVRKLRVNEPARGDLAVFNEEGHLRLRLEDGSWTSIHTGCEAVPFLRMSQQQPQPQPVRQSHANRPMSEQQMLCQVCMDRPKDIAFNCGHQSCQACAQSLKMCPYCRQVITNKIKLYP